MKEKTNFPEIVFSQVDQVRPLTLEEVLRLRNGLEIPRGGIPGYPVQAALAKFKGNEWILICRN